MTEVTKPGGKSKAASGPLTWNSNS